MFEIFGAFIKGMFALVAFFVCAGLFIIFWLYLLYFIAEMIS